jgi:hypothetical protein
MKIRGLSVAFQILQDNPYLIISTLVSETTSCIVNESVQITTPPFIDDPSPAFFFMPPFFSPPPYTFH